jgi:hypothetical protein
LTKEQADYKLISRKKKYEATRRRPEKERFLEEEGIQMGIQYGPVWTVDDICAGNIAGFGLLRRRTLAADGTALDASGGNGCFCSAADEKDPGMDAGAFGTERQAFALDLSGSLFRRFHSGAGILLSGGQSWRV